MADVKPNHTLYINNLNEKVKKDGKYSEPWSTNARDKIHARVEMRVIVCSPEVG